MPVTVLRSGSAARHARAVVREVLQEAGLEDEAIGDAEVVAAELAANAERHARPPYELRVVSLDGVPAWCEVVDGGPDLREVRIILDLLDSVEEIGLPLFAENGRGLLLAHRLSQRSAPGPPALPGAVPRPPHRDPRHRRPRQGRRLRPAHTLR
ncbi:ATP-binding protein [Streptosporangium sp. NPDC023615]|uniref:ATP-binding protein n=1 Tax=Streptosporangium sp. NPDC023615 TaxID=3154794 RepID=UPI003436E4DB